MTLTPSQKRVLKLLLDPESEAETSEEIAQQIHSSSGSVRQLMIGIYGYFGVGSSRGLLRHYTEIVQIINKSD